MSLVSWRESTQRNEESVTGQQWGQDAEDEEKKRKEVTIKHEGEDKHRRKKTRGRKPGNTLGMNEEQVIQADGDTPASICLHEHYLTVSRGLKQKGPGQVQHPKKDGDKCPEEPKGPGPFFFFGGGNGASIVIAYCESRGWQRIYDKTREDYKLKWCELKSSRTYYNFRAGEQLVYQIPNNKVLTTKIGLLNSLRQYERVNSKVNHGRGFRRMKMEEFFPETFRMDIKNERQAFFAQQEGLHTDKVNMWICKPTGLNQGRGIFLLQNQEDMTAFRARIQNTADGLMNRKIPFRIPQAQIVQRYIQKPLLLKGRKFDVRSYFLIASTSPYTVFFRHGYVRLTCDLYDPNSNNLTAHLTNQYMQKKNPLYSVLKEETVWSMECFNAYINEKFMEPKSLPKDWVLSVFTKQMQQIIIQCFLSVKAKLECKLGYFDLIGCDFLIDEDFKVWLLEMNCNPALHTNCEVLKEVVPRTVTETLDLVLEIFDKCRCGLKLLPLSSQRDFVLLYCVESTSLPLAKQRSRTAGPLRHPKSFSTSKKTQRASMVPCGDHLATGPKDCSETVANHSKSSLVAKSSSSFVSSSSSFMDPVETRQNSVNGDFVSTIITTSETPANHNVPTISCLQQHEPQPKPTSGMIQKSPSAKLVEMNQSQSRFNKAKPNRVELRLSKCTWQQPGVTTDLRKPSEPEKPKTTVSSLSSPTQRGESNFTRGLNTQASQDRRSGYLRPELDLAQSLSCQPLRSEKLESSSGSEKTIKN